MGFRDTPPGLIQSTEITQKLQATLGVRGKVMAPRLGDQVHPVVLVADLVHGSREALTERVFASRARLVASAGNTPKLGLRVPTGNSFALIDRVVVSGGTAGMPIWVGSTQSTLATLLAANVLQYLDGRISWNVAPSPPFQMYTEDSVTTPVSNPFHEVLLPANSSFEFLFPFPIVLTQGNSLIVESSTMATTLSGAFYGREVVPQ